MPDDVGRRLRHHQRHPADVRFTELQRFRQLRRESACFTHAARLLDGEGERNVAGRKHYVHRVAVTRVPSPTRETTSNSSTRRLEPPRPSPIPPLVVKPLVIACSRSAMPGPLSSKVSRRPRRSFFTKVSRRIVPPPP